MQELLQIVYRNFIKNICYVNRENDPPQIAALNQLVSRGLHVSILTSDKIIVDFVVEYILLLPVEEHEDASQDYSLNATPATWKPRYTILYDQKLSERYNC